MSHKCPAPGCKYDVRDSMLTCREHWFALPAGLRDAIWRAWDHGAGAGNEQHVEAINAAVRFLAGR